MLDRLLQIDTELLIFLNNLGSEQWDGFWLALTNQFNWSPLFALLLFLIFKKFGWKNGGLILLFLVILITFSDQFTNFIKNTFELVPLGALTYTVLGSMTGITMLSPAANGNPSVPSAAFEVTVETPT